VLAEVLGATLGPNAHQLHLLGKQRALEEVGRQAVLNCMRGSCTEPTLLRRVQAVQNLRRGLYWFFYLEWNKEIGTTKNETHVGGRRLLQLLVKISPVVSTR